jgi:hypothetical protein
MINKSIFAHEGDEHSIVHAGTVVHIDSLACASLALVASMPSNIFYVTADA